MGCCVHTHSSPYDADFKEVPLKLTQKLPVYEYPFVLTPVKTAPIFGIKG